jgi:hypothetical protein
MFSRNKTGSNPLGVPLGDLLAFLEPTSIKASLSDATLLARHEHYTTRIDVNPPRERNSDNGPIRAVVRVMSELPVTLKPLFKAPEVTVAMNGFAGLGALIWNDGKVAVGSRLSIYEADEHAWSSLHLPLLVITTICGTEAILGGMRRAFSNKSGRGGASDWTGRDFEQVEKHMSQICVCTLGKLALTAEFGLEDGAVSAAVGHQTALFRMIGNQPHPELGGGLFCLLKLPWFRDEASVVRACVTLNELEMSVEDLPPHFGAWCKDKDHDCPAYVSFLPNFLHKASGIAVNVAIWAMLRARWAHQVLASNESSS